MSKQSVDTDKDGQLGLVKVTIYVLMWDFSSSYDDRKPYWASRVLIEPASDKLTHKMEGDCSSNQQKSPLSTTL